MSIAAQIAAAEAEAEEQRRTVWGKRLRRLRGLAGTLAYVRCMATELEAPFVQVQQYSPACLPGFASVRAHLKCSLVAERAGGDAGVHGLHGNRAGGVIRSVWNSNAVQLVCLGLNPLP